MSTERDALIEQANNLALEFPPNIPTVKLQGMVDEANGPAVKAEDKSGDGTEDDANNVGDGDAGDAGDGKGLKDPSLDTDTTPTDEGEDKPPVEELPPADTEASAPVEAPVPTKRKRKVTKTADLEPKNGDSDQVRLRKKVLLAKRKASKKVIVTITNKDPRENEFMTTAPLSVENQHFSIGRNVPLDIPVEIEACLAKLAESTMMTHHKDEVVNGRRTGNKTIVSVKKYAVSYAREQPE
jgi:hypothetical protein